MINKSKAKEQKKNKNKSPRVRKVDLEAQEENVTEFLDTQEGFLAKDTQKSG
jgi:hypothetical protein